MEGRTGIDTQRTQGGWLFFSCPTKFISGNDLGGWQTVLWGIPEDLITLGLSSAFDKALSLL
jgi:hypothetical protein